MGRHREIAIEWIVEDNWLHTHGMDQKGLPELEVRDVPGFLGEAAADILREVCDYMIGTGKRIKPGETMELSERTRFRFTSPTPIPGQEDHYEVERLQLVDVEPLCDCCRLKQSELN